MKRLLLVLSFALAMVNLAAQTPKVKITGGPYLQNVTKNSFTVVWTSNMDAVSWVEIAPDDETHFYNTERPKFYDTRGLGRRPITKLHKITVTGLEPGTTYRYRVLMNGVVSAENRDHIALTAGWGNEVRRNITTVTTLSEDYDEVRFAMVNDVHESDSVFRTLFPDAKHKYDFVCFNGDMTSANNTEEGIMQNYLSSASELFGSWTPIVFVRGNHEYRGNAALKWLEHLDTPTGKTYYSYNYGDHFFIVLDGGEDKHDSDIRNLGIMITEDYVKQEAQWLKEVVKSEEFINAKTRIVFCHMNPDDNGWHGQATISKYLVPILNEAGIDLMLCGHIHKFRYEKPGTTSADFPVVCNPNLKLMEASVKADNIRLEFLDENKVVETINIRPGAWK
ncbi:MAG: metallophosphoesterase [Bacteroidales bacterium]|nr:metallophosphoesterase [Bacteroidales bacterium]